MDLAELSAEQKKQYVTATFDRVVGKLPLSYQKRYERLVKADNLSLFGDWYEFLKNELPGLVQKRKHEAVAGFSKQEAQELLQDEKECEALLSLLDGC